MIPYVVYDVFTDRVFGGNQLAVFPDARDIPEDKLQSIAAEFNFSEVTFVYPPEDPAHTARVRIFTPTNEVDFAGHPTIGTLIGLYDSGQTSPMVLELGIGPLSCTVSDAGAAFTASQRLQLFSNPAVPLVAKVLGVARGAIKTATHTPVVASLGIPFVLVELTNETSLSASEPNVAAMREGAALHPDSHDFAIFVYVKSGNQIYSRMFAPLDNIPEDPATGSASATLAALLTQLSNTPQNLIFTQGVDMGRPSRITARTTLNPVTVTIEGQAVKTMLGEFIL